MNKNYYAVESFRGLVSLESEFAQPTLLVFDSKESRQNYIMENDVKDGNINHRVWEITAKEAARNYSKIIDGIRVYDNTECIGGYVETCEKFGSNI